MAKISKKINSSGSTVNNREEIKKSISTNGNSKAKEEPKAIVEKKPNTDFSLDINDQDNQNIPEEISITDNSNITAKLVKSITDKYGADFIQSIRNNSHLNISAYVEKENISNQQWLTTVINTFFDYNDIMQAYKNNEKSNILFNSLVAKANNLQESLKFKEEDFNKKIEYEKTQSEEARKAKSIAEKKLKSSIDVLSFIKINSSEHNLPYQNLLLEAAEEPSKELKSFAPKFIAALNNFIINNIKLPEDEKERMEFVHSQLSIFLKTMQGEYISQRRALLDKLAKQASLYLNDYDFISPEDTLQIDPSIHNAGGLGGLTIKEGISFAVVNRESRHTVKYAEIDVV